jgi:hypothetical protein
MAALILPIAHPGHILAALPFFGPMLMISGGLLFLVWRDRRGRDDSHGDSGDSA